MLHLLLYGLLAVVVALALFLLATRFLPAGEQIAPPIRDEPPWQLPDGRSLVADDVDAVRLPVALRGYRFAETDILLDRLAGELRARDDEISRLRGSADSEPLEPPEPLELDDEGREPGTEPVVVEPAVAADLRSPYQPPHAWRGSPEVGGRHVAPVDQPAGLADQPAGVGDEHGGVGDEHGGMVDEPAGVLDEPVGVDDPHDART